MTDLTQFTWLTTVQRAGTGLAFLVFPVLFIIGFAVHPNLLRPQLVRGVSALMARVRHNRLLQVEHVLVLLSTPLLMIVACECISLSTTGPLAWLGFVGGVMAIGGVLILAADKGALGLVVSAFDTLPDGEFLQLKPGLAAMQTFSGGLVLLRGLALLPLGFALLAIALFSAGALPAWQAGAMLVGTLMLAAPDGFEIVSLIGAVFLAIAFVPLGLHFLV